MVGPEARILFDPATELGEHHDGNVIGPAHPLHVFDEPPDGIGRVGQQSRMGVGLMHVGVEGVPGIADVVQPCRDLRCDQRGDTEE